MKKPYIIGIAGSSGSGKTFFLKSFLDQFKNDEVTLISQDDYYIPANTKTQEENKLYNFDVPTAINRDLFYSHINDLLHGKVISKEEYTFNNPSIKPKTLIIKPAPIIIVEGLFIFHYTEIDKILDYRIFLDAEESVALNRRLKRDLLERGYGKDDVMYKWVNHVVPSYKQYLLPYRNKVDKILINNTDDPNVIDNATQQLYKMLSSKI